MTLLLLSHVSALIIVMFHDMTPHTIVMASIGQTTIFIDWE